ncbi:MAG TPA: sulfite exporter TauE/SafE family protein [Stellaceae bacterium]|nr:sulfite exporter TauE/SafE family protein [Stellaceae bacterium]
MSGLLALLCGSAVGFSLGLIGGGGSILAVPLLLYVVGIGDAHVAIGTSALAVAANAFVNLIGHWRAGTVKWPCAAAFAAAGIAGAALGSSFGKAIDGQKLLFVFALVMVAVGIAMLRPRAAGGDPGVRITPAIAVRLVSVGLVVGAISGFFGIGGGFLIVPGIMLGSGMPILNAIGSSLFSVGAFGLTTAANYAISGLIDWRIAAEFIAGGAAGGWLGMRLAVRLAPSRRTLSTVFAGVIFAVAAYMLLRTGFALFG